MIFVRVESVCWVLCYMLYFYSTQYYSLSWNGMRALVLLFGETERGGGEELERERGEREKERENETERKRE